MTLSKDRSRAAFRSGAGGLETDVRATRDRVLVLNHDAMLADGRLASSLTAAELPASIPLLEELLPLDGDPRIAGVIGNHREATAGVRSLLASTPGPRSISTVRALPEFAGTE